MSSLRPALARLLRRSALLLLGPALLVAAEAQSPSWVVRHQRTGGFLWSIAANGDSVLARLVTVGLGGRILVSDDGVVWSERNSGVTDWLVGVAYGYSNGPHFIAVGDHGRILTSPNGDTWTAVPNVPTAARLNAVLFSDQLTATTPHGLWVAVGEGGTALVSDDNGVTWRAGATGLTGWLRGLTFLSPRSYLFAPRGGGTSGLSTIRGVGEYAFVATGQGGKIILSTDGLTWMPMASGTTEDLEAVTGTSSTSPIYVGSFNHALAIGSSGVVRRYDGLTSYFSGDLNGYTGPPPTFPAYAAWTAGSLDTTNDIRFRGLATNQRPYSGGGTPILLAAGEGGVVLVNNQQQATGVRQNLVAAVYAGSKYYVVGEDETILQQANPVYLSRLADLATRAAAGGSRGTLIGGVSITGTGPKRVLVRAVGPGLGAFNLAGPMPQPTLAGYDAAGHPTVGNSGWADDPALAAAAQSIGTFPLAAGSKDAALITTLAPGGYTFLVQPAAGTAAGVALFEVYDLDAPSNTAPRLANVSSRGFVGGNAEVLIGGFVVNGSSSSNVLVRGLGPALRAFGVTDALTDCAISVYRGAQLIATNDEWGANANATQLRFTFTQVGAFELAPDSKDAALLLANLFPGNYTVVLTAQGGATGTGLIEIYELP